MKDIKLAVQMAQQNNASPLLGRVVEFINEIAQAQGYGDKDTAVMWKCYRQIWEGKKEL